MKTRILLLSAFIFLFYSFQAQIINVPGDYSTIQEGINAASDGDTVLVDSDTYYENIKFNGKAITVASQYIIEGDTNFINNTIIDGSQPVNPDNGSVVTFSSGEDSTSVICGFTITGGTGTYLANTDEQYGGGIYCSYAGAKIMHNKIINNTSQHSNHASGGGIGCRFGSSWIVIRSNTISNNVASSDGMALGGGIYSRYNSLLISNNVISHDSLSGYDTFGGAVSISYTYHTEMTGNIITRNKVNNIDIYWNGVYFFNPIGIVNIFQNEFSYNDGAYTENGACGGLGIYNAYEYPVIVDRNQFLHNNVFIGGGFIEVNSYNVKLTNNIFIGNDAYMGGAIRIYHLGSSNEYRPQIINNTFFSNSASEYGGAISYEGDFSINGSSPVIINCIFWENSASGWGKDIDNVSNDTVFVYNSDINVIDIYGEWDGENNFYANPELEEDSAHLLGSSPCIDTGIDSLEINGIFYYCPDNDIDGDPRPLNNVADVGADEYVPAIGIFNFDNTLDNVSIEIFPNPFTTSTTLSYSLKQASTVQLSVYNQLGQLVFQHSEEQQQGSQRLQWDAQDQPEGLYFYRLKAGDQVATGKLVKAPQ